MEPLDLALNYMEIFYSDSDIEALGQILAKNLSFEGPFFQFDSAEDYLNSLRGDSREGLAYELIKSFADEASACLIYQFSKPGISMPMAQMFETDGDKIGKIVLIFDTGAFT
jgi:hypothetical protein